MSVAAASPRVRRAVPADLAALLALELAAFPGDRLSPRQYARHLDSASAVVLVATDAGHRVLGSAVLFFRRHAGVARLYSLATDPAARGRGVARALLASACRLAVRRRCRSLRLEVRTDNAAAIHLYERTGYVRFGRREHYYEDGAAAWRYELALG